MRRMKIAVLDTDTFGRDIDLSIFSDYGTVSLYPNTLYKQTIDRVQECDIIITNKVVLDRFVMDKCPRLKLICIAATGTNNVDLDYAEQRNILVKNAVGYSSKSVAQSVLSGILHFLNKPGHYDAYVKDGSYSKNDIFTYVGHRFWELGGKTVGIIGLGNIGKAVARIFEAMDANVVYYSTSGLNDDLEFCRVSLSELLHRSDIISVHAPLNQKTKNLIGERELKSMKKSAIIANFGRGGIINEGELAKSLDDGDIAGAIIDVFEKEPIPSDHVFLRLKHPDKILLSPHSSWASIESRTALIHIVARNIQEFQAGLA